MGNSASRRCLFRALKVIDLGGNKPLAVQLEQSQRTKLLCLALYLSRQLSTLKVFIIHQQEVSRSI